MDEVFAAGTRPKTVCPMHKIVSAKLPEPIAQRCEELGGAEHRLVDLGDEFYDWARMEGMASEPWLTSECAARSTEPGALLASSPRTVSPHSGHEFLLFPDLPLRDQAIPLRIRPSPGAGALPAWLADR